MIDHAHIVFRESSSEPGEGGMIRSGIVKRKPQELFERDSVIDLGFQLRIGIDLEPLLKKKAFHQDKRRIGIVAFKAFTDGVVSHKQVFYSGPINNGVDLFHSFDGPVLFHGIKKGYIGKGEVGFHVFEAHSSSRRFNLKELCLKRKHLSSNIINNINILSYFYRSLTAKEIGKTLAI
jgi:hypothetical protein